MRKILIQIFSRNNFPVLLCTSLMLFFLGLYLNILFQANGVLQSVQNEKLVLVELKVGTNDVYVDQLRRDILSLNGVIQESYSFIPKSEALNLMESDFDQQILIEGAKNPFPDIISLRILNEPDFLKELEGFLESSEWVLNTGIHQTDPKEVKISIRRIKVVSLSLALFFTLLSLLLVINAVRQHLTESRQLYMTLKLLGADLFYIRRPFLLRSFYTGTISAILALFLILILNLVLFWQLEIFAQFFSFGILILVFFLILIIGIIFSISVTSAILSGILARETDD